MRTRILALALALSMAGCAATTNSDLLAPNAPRALPASGPVSVAWEDPATFSELRTSGNRFAASRGDWLLQLATYMRTQADKYLPDGHTLQLTIVDIQRAGQYEPWLRPEMQDARIIRNVYPPRMTVSFRELDAAGNVVNQGERKLTDLAFLMNSPPINNTDPLRYEKRMLDTWLRREFQPPVAAR